MAVHVKRYGTSGLITCAVAESQGARGEQEDAYTVSVGNQCASMWVLDGHHGAAAAQFSGPALDDELGHAFKGEKLPSDERILQGFRTVDNRLRQHFKQHPKDAKSGSTAVGFLAAQQGDGVFDMKLINCGDSRGVVLDGTRSSFAQDMEAKVKNKGKKNEGLHHSGAEGRGTGGPEGQGKGGGIGGPESGKRHQRRRQSFILETMDHKPHLPTERARIEAAGGHVVVSKPGQPHRIDGNLAVSRGFGDFAFKSNRRLSPAEQKVTCAPDIYELHGLHPGSVVILACDGLWDVISTEDAAKIVQSKITCNKDLADIAAELVNAGLKKRSQDNITVLLAQFGKTMLDGGKEPNPREGKDPLAGPLLGGGLIDDLIIFGHNMTVGDNIDGGAN